MDTHIYTASACYALASVYIDPRFAVFDFRDACTYRTANLDAFITPYAIVVGINYTIFTHTLISYFRNHIYGL